MLTIIWFIWFIFIIAGCFICKAVRIIHITIPDSKRNMQDSGSGGTPEGMQTNTVPLRQTPVHTNRNNGRAGQHPGPMAQAQQTKPDVPAQQGSTMAYLEEKARQDAIEHAKEKREEAKRLYQNAGGLRAAERLYEGDGVPSGKRRIVCGYCGAENLVPVMMRERYSCYFCREPIQ